MKSKPRTVFVNLLLFAILANLAACGGGGSSDTTTQPSVIALQRAFPNLPNLGAIVVLKQAPSDGSVWYAVIQDGRVLSFANTAIVFALSTFIDWSGQVAAGGEMGLLGMAFDPQYARNGKVCLQDTCGYADTYSSRIWGLKQNGSVYASTQLIDSSLQYIYSFAEDHQGELYVLSPDFGSSVPGSNIYKIVAP